jgi:hypothetical protein
MVFSMWTAAAWTTRLHVWLTRSLWAPALLMMLK